MSEKAKTKAKLPPWLNAQFLAFVATIAAFAAFVQTGFNGIHDEMAQLRMEVSQSRTEAKADLHAARTELKTDIGALRSEVRTDIGELRSEVRADIGELRADIRELRGDMRGLDDRLRSVGTRLAGLEAVLPTVQRNARASSPAGEAGGRDYSDRSG